MFKVHGFFEGKKVIDWRMEHLPRLGETMRFQNNKYGEVTEVIWCMDESNDEGQRVNIKVCELPPQREWVGLTDEQVDACWNKDLWKARQPHNIFARAIEARLKEKNT